MSERLKCHTTFKPLPPEHKAAVMQRRRVTAATLQRVVRCAWRVRKRHGHQSQRGGCDIDFGAIERGG